MSTVHNPSRDGDWFRDFIEERYAEWDREYGDEVDERRAFSFGLTK